MKFHKLLVKSYGTIGIILALGLLHVSGQNKTLEFKDKVYEENIKTAILFRSDDPMAAPVKPAAISILQPVALVLKFDDIYTDDADYYRAKIIHCDYQWQPSPISPLDYLHEYNDFLIDEFDFSIATKVPYTHFTFPIPRVKIPGNYLLVVFREPDENDIIISKRFIVFDQRIRIMGNVGLSTGVVQRRFNQQIEFSLDYKSFPVANPYLDIKVAVRQNHRWDNAILNLQPTMIKEDVQQIEYRHFNFENNFKAGNEFRFFDIRSIHFGGRNVEKTNISDTQINAYLYTDKSRGTEPYTFVRDLNGGFIVQNSEGSDNFLESDYINVNFFLEPDEAIEDDIFIAGKLTDWDMMLENKMEFNQVSGLYMGNLLLKQGIYDFIYYLPGHTTNPYYFEGNHADTKNEYEIIVYYRDPTMSTDIIVGYLWID